MTDGHIVVCAGPKPDPRVRRAAESSPATVTYVDDSGDVDAHTDAATCVLLDADAVDAVSILERVREDYPDTEFLVTTATGTGRLAHDAVDAGADQYLPRDVLDDAELTEALTDAAEPVWASFEPGLDGMTPQQKRQLFDQLFEQLPFHLFVKDRDTRHLVVSHAIHEPEMFLGKVDTEIEGLTDSHLEEASAADRRVVETGEPILDTEEYLPSLDKWNLTSKVPWRDERGEVQGLIGLSLDITERKEREREIARQNDRLESFAGVVAHDLRSPLQVADSYLTLAREQGDDSHLDDVADAHNRLEAIIDDVLLLAREGRAVVEPETVSLETVCADAWDDVDAANATMTVDCDQTVVYADSGRLQRLLSNLFRNATEHAVGSESVSVRVGCLGATDSQGFYVEDDGPGIPVDERDAVLEAGYTTAEDGTGFGLSIVREIASAHGWTVSVTESAPGGARFEFRGVDTPPSTGAKADA